MTTSLEPLFNPSSIAVVGASSDPGKISGMPIAFLKNFGYRGEIFPVNPRSAEIQGLRAWPSLEAIGRPVDMAICAVPAHLVAETVDQAAAVGVRSMVVFSSGFAEVGEEGRRAQGELSARARKAGIRLLGPNCLGLVNVASRVPATFTPALLSGLPRPGGIAIVSQSGAFGMFAFVRARERGLGISHFVATGNESDVEFADCVDYLIDDPAVKVVLGYVEGVRNGDRFVAAMCKAQAAGKPIAVCKVGRSELGAKAAASHTAALAGRDEVYDALFRQFGVFRAANLEELFDIGYAFDVSPPAQGNRLGIVSISGGAGVMMADSAERFGLDLAPMPQPEQARLLERVPFASAVNPVDITGQVLNDLTLLDDTLDSMADAGYHAIASFQAVTGVTPAHRGLVTDTWSRFRVKHPGIVAAVVTVFDDVARRYLESHGVLAFEEPERAIRALGALAGFARPRAGEQSGRGKEAGQHDPGPAPLDEAEALAWLGRAGVPVVHCLRAATSAEAVTAAESIGYPVVLKILSPDIAHKSDVGGVVLKLVDGNGVRQAFERVTQSVSKAMPEARIDGVLIAPMLPDGVEVIVGVFKDPVFGPLVMFGLGGVLVEILKDVSFRKAPFDRAEAHRMIREIRASHVLDGVRGTPPADVEALADLLSRLSHFADAYRDRFESIDINPVLVFERGKGVRAVDALVCTNDGAEQ
jgi:acyl-CoA synthetase (NDP forming)